MRMTPNLNGTSPEELIEQRIKIYDAIEALKEFMQPAMPHPRDYQLTSPDAYGLDRQEWSKFLDTLEEFSERMSDEILTLKDMFEE